MSRQAQTNGGPAFPTHEISGEARAIDRHSEDGMSLRDYFAAHAPVDIESWFLPPTKPRLPAFPEVSDFGFTDEEAERMRRWISDSAGCDARYFIPDGSSEDRYILADQLEVAFSRVRNERKQLLAAYCRRVSTAWRYAWADAMLEAREAQS